MIVKITLLNKFLFESMLESGLSLDGLIKENVTDINEGRELLNESIAVGLLLASGYSQNSSEARREGLIKHSMETGEIAKHLSTPVLQRAVDNNTHPALVYGSPKLRDFAGSISEPETWTGGGQGLGYTIDRHQHDAAMGQKFGDDSRAISSGDTAIRRYRTLQAAHHLAHQFYDPSQNLSRPQFQALSWVGWRGAS
jgi:hypothetical protein